MTAMTKEQAAAALDKNEYRKEGSKELFEKMKAAGLVAVFGASDDLCEFRGAIYDEVGAYQGAEISITSKGLLKNECSNDECPYHAKIEEDCAYIEVAWGIDQVPWTIRTDIPHETFIIFEDDNPFCIGIVFALADVTDPV